MHILKTGLLAILPLFLATGCLAEAEQSDQDASSATSITQQKTPDELSKIHARVEKELDQKVESITPSPVQGLYEVVVPPKVFYMSADGRYLITGDLVDLQDRTNLSSGKRTQARKAALKNIGEASMIVFSPKEVKHTISVFTDIDCGYCRKLHSEMAAYNKLGIKVRYLAYPRAGIGSPSYKKAVAVWCADDKAKAMTTAKSGGNVPEKDCENPVAKQFELGQELGVNGTPALMLENGQIYPGYAPADKLIGILDQVKAQSAAAK